jgi:hypothetical protein
VAAFRPRVLRVGDAVNLVVAVIPVRVDELLRTKFVALLEVEPAGVAKRTLRDGLASPKWSGRDMAVETLLLRGCTIGIRRRTALARTCGGDGREGGGVGGGKKI